ncbi:MAG: hypothetical protein ACREYF_00415 [Gammaproteobacteria bacterium]
MFYEALARGGTVPYAVITALGAAYERKFRNDKPLLDALRIRASSVATLRTRLGIGW